MNQICPLPPLDTPRERPLFITGIDTEIGKTFVATRIASKIRANGLRAGVYKPVASGCHRDTGENLVSEDAVQLWRAAGNPETIDAVCPQKFSLPLSPPSAAEAEGKRVDIERMIAGAQWWRKRCDILVVEGAGGLMSPLAIDYFNADLARDLACDVIIVAANRLGMINHTLMTLHVAKSYKLSVVGIVLNNVTAEADCSSTTNAGELSRYADVPILGTFDFQRVPGQG
jgi:dethiobiotin synthetase